jgi:antitoxin FitA
MEMCYNDIAMTTITIPDVADDIAARLRRRAAVHGRTVEAEARSILADALGGEATAAPEGNLADAIRAIMAPLGGADLEPFPAQPAEEPIKLD